MKKNKLIIASAGSGKTTYLVNDAINALKLNDGNILITTYTISNKEEIKKKFIEINRCIPKNITVQTWFSFLIQHGAKPYQGKLYEKTIKGMLLTNRQSAQYIPESEIEKHYFTKNQKIYSDKLSKFVVRCNEKSQGLVLDRLSRIYSHIYVDEVQDLAGYDLEILKLFFDSTIKTLMVGDPRQVTYLTHQDKLHSKYKYGKIEQYIKDKKLDCFVDTNLLKYSHRNNSQICSFSSKLYPDFPESKPCGCPKCRDYIPEHIGIYLIRRKDVSKYIELFKPTVLRYENAIDNEWNFGRSKGLTFDRVIIFPTKTIEKYLRDGILMKKVTKKNKKTKKSKIITHEAFDIAKFYVAITRAKYSVGIVVDYNDEKYIDGIQKYEFK